VLPTRRSISVVFPAFEARRTVVSLMPAPWRTRPSGSVIVVPEIMHVPLGSTSGVACDAAELIAAWRAAGSSGLPSHFGVGLDWPRAANGTEARVRTSARNFVVCRMVAEVRFVGGTNGLGSYKQNTRKPRRRGCGRTQQDNRSTSDVGGATYQWSPEL